MMEPADGTREYEEQAEQVRALLRTMRAADEADEEPVVALFAWDPQYSRAAIMDGVSRWRKELRNTTSSVTA